MVYFYFSYVDPWGVQPRPLQDLVVFVVVTATIVVATFLSSMRLFRPLQEWRERLLRGADPGEVPAHLRRRALNRPLIAATFSMTGWTLAGIFYLPYQLWVVGFGLEQAWRVFVAIVFVGGPVASALAFLVAEYYSRRDVPLFFPAGRIERSGVLRVPILVRLGATFFVTSVLPPLLMMMVSLSLVRRFGGELPEEMRPLWMQLLHTQAYIVVATGGASFVMALLVARFINRPVQALAPLLQRAEEPHAGEKGRDHDGRRDHHEHHEVLQRARLHAPRVDVAEVEVDHRRPGHVGQGADQVAGGDHTPSDRSYLARSRARGEGVDVTGRAAASPPRLAPGGPAAAPPAWCDTPAAAPS